MKKNRRSINGGAPLLGLSFIVSVLTAGCGGSGDGAAGSVTGSAVASYIADQRSGGFVGSWFATGPASASANVDTLAPTATTNTYTATNAQMLLNRGTWGVDPNAWMYYSLTSSGWALRPNTGTLADSGNGSDLTYTVAGEVPIAAKVARTSLQGTAIACTVSGAPVACAVPGNYPAGAASYPVTYTNASESYYLWDIPGASASLQLTDASGVALTTLPAVGDTFCIPYFHAVFKAIAAPGAGPDNYDVHGTTSCLAADIATAISANPYATVLIGDQATGNAVVPNVLRIQSAAAGGWTNLIWGLRAGNVWAGYMAPAGTSTGTSKNWVAINAELVASGLAALP